MRLLGGSKRTGILTSAKNIDTYKGKHSFHLIHQSITGVFEQEIDLLGDEF